MVWTYNKAMGFETNNQLSFNLTDEPKSNFKAQPERVFMPDADVLLYRNLFDKVDSDNLYQTLLKQTRWRQDRGKFYGKEIDLPRLTAWYGDSGKTYTYSGIVMNPDPWTPTLLYIKGEVDKAAETRFNSVLLNLYRNGQDGLSWHRDNESELGAEPPICSVSLGATRRFQFKHRLRKDLARVDIDLTHGSLLVMKGTTQQYWLHQIPKTKKHVTARINLTFRIIN
jgi:alkylated DNA repair dioxygenase AlkB